MKKLAFLATLFVFASAGNLQANDVYTITEGGCTMTATTFSEDGNIYEIILDAVSGSESLSESETCLTNRGRITFKAKEGATN